MQEIKTMNDENDEFDPRLEALFAREHTHLPAEPFSATVLRAILADRKHAVLTTRVLLVAGIVMLITLAPLIINGSIWVAMRLDELTAVLYAWLSSPAVLAGVALVALAAFATKWARIW
jgi:hypothetical protein